MSVGETVVRSLRKDAKDREFLETSVYNAKGVRRIHSTTYHVREGMTLLETDTKFGVVGRAIKQGYSKIEDVQKVVTKNKKDPVTGKMIKEKQPKRPHAGDFIKSKAVVGTKNEQGSHIIDNFEDAHPRKWEKKLD